LIRDLYVPDIHLESTHRYADKKSGGGHDCTEVVLKRRRVDVCSERAAGKRRLVDECDNEEEDGPTI
jgi:hypothetical protein